MRRGPKPKLPVDRFWSKVDRSGGLDACWPWMAGRFESDYGAFNDGESIVTASSFALSLVKPKTPGQFACHTCDNPPCCNQLHLFWGTQAVNMADAKMKGRTRGVQGAEHYRSKFTADIVATIRTRYVAKCPINGASAIAAELGVTAPSIRQIVTGRTWRHTFIGVQ